MKKIINKVKEIFTIKKRYVFDRKELKFIEDTFHKDIIKYSLLMFAILFFIICAVQKRDTYHMELAQKNYEAVQVLQDSISNQKFMEDEISLLTEIGKVSITEDCEPCTKENICAYIDYLAEAGIVWYPDIIKNNCKMESNFGSSKVAKKYHNLFGMDHPNIRKTLSTNNSGRFATFKNWKCSVLDRVLWDYSTFRGKIPTRKQYIDKIGTKYNTVNENYKNSIK